MPMAAAVAAMLVVDAGVVVLIVVIGLAPVAVLAVTVRLAAAVATALLVSGRFIGLEEVFRIRISGLKLVGFCR